MDVDPVEALRAELALRGVSPMQQPDDEMLRVMLDVEHGSVTRAARAISDAQLAEDRHSAASSSIDNRARVAAAAAAAAGAHRAARRGRAVTHESVWDTRGSHSSGRRVVAPSRCSAPCSCSACARSPRAPCRAAPAALRPSRFAEDPRASARTWIAELERDTHGTLEPDGVRTLLPPFYAGSYAEALVHAKEHIHILVVVLTSAAHADDDYFRTRVLTDPQLVDTLRGADLTVWGGDVRAREAHQVASLLRATTFPFVAFIALQPRRSRSRGAVVGTRRCWRLEGSPHTSAVGREHCTHITTCCCAHRVPRAAARRAQPRERERQLKADQDRALAPLGAHGLVPAGPPRRRGGAPVGAPAERAQPAAAFASDAPLEAVYAYVDTADAEGDAAPAPPDGYVHTYAFQLVQTYPRHTLDVSQLATPLKALPDLGRSANLVVETTAGAAAHASDASDASDADDA
ncbi:ucp10 [Malassezia furfur]|nr:ucp10 [Malassezia furfur]